MGSPDELDQNFRAKHSALPAEEICIFMFLCVRACLRAYVCAHASNCALLTIFFYIRVCIQELLVEK